ncbi:hypothetical protein L596_026135 [Steinernema carpocapsae]|uniref:Uncharacterized protein n=1 Tax=Steinernema carpocapsae TaxID=34508 RepID=A0A4U5M0G4_STECR|nr:hypothetical protein L596_026135 [Steinernema carpocapsae]
MKTEHLVEFFVFLVFLALWDVFNQKSTQSPTRNVKKNDNFDRRIIANPIPSSPTAIVQGSSVRNTEQLVKFSFLSYPIAILRCPKAVSRRSDARIVISAFKNLSAPEMSVICDGAKKR